MRTVQVVLKSLTRSFDWVCLLRDRFPACLLTSTSDFNPQELDSNATKLIILSDDLALDFYVQMQALTKTRQVVQVQVDPPFFSFEGMNTLRMPYDESQLLELVGKVYSESTSPGITLPTVLKSLPNPKLAKDFEQAVNEHSEAKIEVLMKKIVALSNAETILAALSRLKTLPERISTIIRKHLDAFDEQVLAQSALEGKPHSYLRIDWQDLPQPACNSLVFDQGNRNLASLLSRLIKQ